MPDRIHNISAGPAVLPESVLRKAQDAIWNASGSDAVRGTAAAPPDDAELMAVGSDAHQTPTPDSN